MADTSSASRMPPPRPKWAEGAFDLAVRCAILGLACFLLCWLAVWSTRVGSSVAAVWPSSAVMLAVLLRSPPVRWPAYLLTGYIAATGANLIYGDNYAIAAGLPLGNILETLISAVVLRRLFPDGFNLNDLRQLLALILVTIVTIAASGALIGGAILEQVQPGSFWRTWLNWWTAVGTGVVLICPIMLAWGKPMDGPRFKRHAETTIVIAVAVICTFGIFSQTAASVLYPIFPVLLWAAIRLGPQPTSLACLAVAITAGVLTAFDNGPIAKFDFDLDVTFRVLQSFITIVAFTSQAVAIALQRHREIEKALRLNEQRFRDLAASASDRFWETDPDYRFTWLSERNRPLHFPYGDLIGKTRFEMTGIDTTNDPSWQRHAEDIVARRPFRDFRYSILDNQGRLHFRSISGKPFFDTDGTYLGYRGTSTDITDSMEVELLATRLGRVIDEALNEIFIIDAATQKFIFANRTARESLGYSMDELRGMTSLDICPDLDKATLAERLATLDAQRSLVLAAERTHQRKDGTIYEVEAYMQRVDVAGLAPVYAVFAIDVTSRMEVQSQLDKKSLMLQATLDNMTQGIAVYDKELRLVAYNDQYVELLGYEPGFIQVGGKLEDHFRDCARRGLYGPDNTEAHISERLEAVRHRIPRRRLYRRPDGRFISSNRRPMPDGGSVTTFLDVTERVQSEDALRQASRELQDLKATFEAAVIASRQVLYQWDTKTNVIIWHGDTREILGYERQELRNLAQLMHIIHPDDLPEFQQEVAQIAGRRAPFYMEYRLRHKDGRYIHVSDHGVHVGSGTDKRHRIVGFLADISAQKTAQEALRRSDKLLSLGQFTGGVAHDFNNLLGIVRGNLELLEEDIGHDPDLRRRIQTAMTAIDRGAALTQRLLAYARKQPLKPEPTNINRLITDLSDLINRSINPSIKIDMSLDENLWLTLIDPNDLETSLLNLVLNARDAMPKGGHLRIETANTELREGDVAAISGVKPGSYVMLAVHDTGVGMTPDVKARAFDPFFTTKEVGRGSGLGLAIVYGFVTQSRGHVTLDSEPNKGTTVRLYLPQTSATTVSAAPAHDQGSTQARRTGDTAPLILIVEDDPEVRLLAETMLAGLGYRTLTAQDAGSALNALAENPDIRLLFTDIVLPGGVNGVDLARQACEKHPKLKVLYTSGYTENAILQEKTDHNIALISKPYRKNELARKLRQVLEEESDDAR